MCQHLEWRRSYRDKRVHAFPAGSIRPFMAAEALCTHTVPNNYLGSSLLMSQLDMNEVCPMCLMTHGIEVSEQTDERDAWGKRNPQT